MRLKILLGRFCITVCTWLSFSFSFSFFWVTSVCYTHADRHTETGKEESWLSLLLNGAATQCFSNLIIPAVSLNKARLWDPPVLWSSLRDKNQSSWRLETSEEDGHKHTRSKDRNKTSTREQVTFLLLLVIWVRLYLRILLTDLWLC